MRRLLVLLVLVVVNAPPVHEAWTDHRLDTDGRDVRAAVVDLRSEDGRNFVDYRLPSGSDPARTVFSARIDDETYRAAARSEFLEVRVLAGNPGANRPEGEVRSPLLLVAALGADTVLVLAGALVWWRRRRRAADGPDLYDHL